MALIALIDLTVSPPRTIGPNALFVEVMTWDLFKDKPEAGAYATWLLASSPEGVPWKVVRALWEAVGAEPQRIRHVELVLPGDTVVRKPGVWQIDKTRAFGVVYGPGELDVTYVITWWPADTFSRWEVRTLDVWGNPNDGFDVNQSYKSGEIVLGDDEDDAIILRRLAPEFLVPEHLDQIEIDDADDGFFAIVNKTTGRPLLHLFKIAENAQPEDED